MSTAEKLEQISGFITQNADILIEERQEERRVFKVVLKKAAENTDKKKDDKKMNLELFKVFPEFESIRYGIWVNPTQKTQFRPWPINFVDLGIQCEVPKLLMT